MSGLTRMEIAYGDELRVQPLMGSEGPAVDLEYRENGTDSWEFFRLTPEHAMNLGEALVKAAKDPM